MQKSFLPRGCAVSSLKILLSTSSMLLPHASRSRVRLIATLLRFGKEAAGTLIGLCIKRNIIRLDAHACADDDGPEPEFGAYLESGACGSGSEHDNDCSLQDTVGSLLVILPKCVLQSIAVAGRSVTCNILDLLHLLQMYMFVSVSLSNSLCHTRAWTLSIACIKLGSTSDMPCS